MTERAAQLSEDNRILLEQCKELEQKQAELETENARLQEQIAASAAQNELSGKLYDIYGLLYEQEFEAAKAALAELDVNALDPKQKQFYDILVIKAK